MPGGIGACKEPTPRLAVVQEGSDVGKRLVDRAGTLEREGVGLPVSALHVERLGAVGEGVHRGADRLLERERERQLGVVEDSGEGRARAAALHPALRVSDPEARGPLGARVRRRDRDNGKAGRDRDRLGKVDRAAATDREQAVGVAGRGRDLVDPVARHLAPGAGGRQVELRPALAGDQERPLDPDLTQQLRELTETPADDHVDSLARANSTKASAAREGERPAGRTSEISRAGSRPFTRAVASVPAASSASTPEREMKVTPKPAAAALLTDSCRPSSSRTSRSRRRTGPRRSSSSITWRTPAPSCMRISGSSRSCSSVISLPANGWSGGTTRITSSRKKGSNTTPRCRGDAPTIPSSSSRSATCSMTRLVSEIENATVSSGCSRWNSPSRTGTTVPPGPVEAPSVSSPRSAPSSPASSSSSCPSTASIRCAAR